MKQIHVSQPWMHGNEKKYVNQALKENMISSQGNFIAPFEELFSYKHGSKYGVACSSGTTALIIALRALGIGKDDEVIVPEFTMIATAWAVSMVGATPVFVDCGTDLNIRADKIEEKITSKTKAIIPVHIYGRQCEMDKIMEIAYEYGLRVVEDSCEAHGVKRRGDIACFSLFANKIITAGEGGICVTSDPYLAEQMKHLRGMAFNKDHTFLHKKLGYNFRMTNLQAAVALAQTELLDNILHRRKEIEKWYDTELSSLGGRKDIEIMPKRDVLWMYDIKVARNDREALLKTLKEAGIETRVGFKPMSMQPMYQDMYEHLLAYKASMEVFYLPTFTGISRKQVRYICKQVKKFYGQKSKIIIEEERRRVRTQGSQAEEEKNPQPRRAEITEIPVLSKN